MLIRRLFANTALWSMAVPLAACSLLAIVWGRDQNWQMLTAATLALLATVMIAVHHAEVIAHRVGEPFGTLVLALAVTVIEASLIVSMMLAGGADTAALARDTVFATVMIICNGVIGICLLLGSMKHGVIDFKPEGTTPALAVLATLSVLTMVLPDFTSSTPGPTLSNAQLAFTGIVSLILYGIFIFVQTIRHRNYFLPSDTGSEDTHANPPSAATAFISLAFLLISLVAVVGLAKVLAPAIETAVVSAGMPHAVVGIAIALMVLLPETVAAVRAARNDRMQTSFNLALGSALATIGLTIPVVAAISIFIGLPLALGLPAKEITLLALTLLLTSMTLASGRATVLQGAVHLVVFAVFLFLAMVP